jgi:hypothetical protein
MSPFGVICLCLLVSGCTPIRVPTRTQDSSGKPADVDLNFLKADLTTREEVTQHFAAIDTRVIEPGFFWGRWASSSSINFGPMNPSPWRSWGERNLLVEFNQQGTARSWMVVGDSGLQDQLHRLTAADRPLDLSAPVHMSAEVFGVPAASLLVASEYMQCDKPSWISTATARYSGCSGMKIPRAQITRITSRWIIHDHADPLIWVKIRIASGNGIKEREISVGTDPPSLLLLHRYLNQTLRGPAKTHIDSAMSSAFSQRIPPDEWDYR